MAKSDASSATAKLLTLVTALVAIGVLYIGKQVLIPLALAILLSFLLAPVVRRLERLGLWRIPSVLLVTTLALALIAGVGYILGGQILQLGDRLPQYRVSIHERIAAIRSGGGGVLGRAGRNIQDIGHELTTSSTATTEPAAPAEPSPPPPAVPRPAVEASAPPLAPASSSASQPPVPVQVVNTSLSPLLEYAGGLLGSLVSPLLTAGIVAVFSIFMLVQREDLRDRLIRLAGEERLDVTTQAMDDTARRISRYLLMQATVNTSMGLLVALGLWLIGLPMAFLWGLLAAVMRFIPYVGIWIAAALPIVLSLAIFPHGWLAPLAVAALFLVLELAIANVVEPLVYGGSTGLSPLAVLVAAIFWAWLWGPVGLLLSTPLTVCLVVMGKYVPTLSFLHILLGDEPVLDPSVRLYQRLLAADQEEAEESTEERLEETSLIDVYDSMMIPCLHLAEFDRHRGRLEDSRQTAIYRAVREIMENLNEREQELRPPPEDPVSALVGPPEPALAADKKPMQVLCLAARD
jgi:predicted PurR-regulated permease PerM